MQYHSSSQGLDGGVSANRRENNKQQAPIANWRSTQGKKTICKWKETNKLEGGHMMRMLMSRLRLGKVIARVASC